MFLCPQFSVIRNVCPRITQTKTKNLLQFLCFRHFAIRFCFLESRLDSTYQKPGTKRSTKEWVQHIWPRIQLFPSNNSRNFCRSVHVHSLLYRLCRSQVFATTKTTKQGSSWIGRGRKRSLSTYISCHVSSFFFNWEMQLIYMRWISAKLPLIKSSL